MEIPTIPSPAKRPSPLVQIGAGLRPPAVVVLLIGLVLLALGMLRMPSFVGTDGAFDIVDLGAPSPAALSLAKAEVTGRSWLMAGTVLTYVGWAALLAFFVRARGRTASRSTVPRLAVATIVFGLALLAVGVIQVPRHLDLGERFGRLPDRVPEDFLSLPIMVPGRDSMDLGTAFVALGGVGLLGSRLARQRRRRGASSSAQR